MVMTQEQLTTQERAALDTALRLYGSWSQVTGIDLGPEYTGKKPTGRRAVRIHVVQKKLDLAALTPNEKFRDEIDGIPVDVLQRRYYPAIEGLPEGSLDSAESAQRFNPLRPGISVSHRLCPSGTLGMFVRDNVDGKLSLLTNWHILADSSFAEAGDGITQPGATDGGVAADTIATLTRSILDENGDAAIAAVNDVRNVELAIRGLNRVPTSIRDPQIGDIVVKSGRSTDVTIGRVEGFGKYFPIYRTRDRVEVDGFEIVPLDPANPQNIELSSNGDSGSVWLLKDSDTLVGVHFAGERDGDPDKEVALACYATRVFESLNISLA